MAKSLTFRQKMLFKKQQNNIKIVTFRLNI